MTTKANATDDSFHVFDTTLRDGAQREGINLTVAEYLIRRSAHRATGKVRS